LLKLKFKFKFDIMKTLTMLEFRRDARRALAAVRRGERIVLTYRGKPVARLEPLASAPGRPNDDDPLLRLDDFAVDGPGGPLADSAIDRALYGS